MVTAALAASLVPGCDPSFGLRVRQRLAPAPAAACVHSALLASPDVARAVPVGRRGRARRQYRVTLSDPALGYPPERGVEVDAVPATPGSAAAAVVSVTHRWTGSSRLPPEEERLFAAGAARLLEGLRRACAPESPPSTECAYVGARPGACRAAYPAGR